MGLPRTTDAAPSATGADRWPETVRTAFAPATDPVAARAYTWQLAHSHYENFSVVSTLLPQRLRQDFCNIYAFCRIADDLGDEVGDKRQSLDLLGRFRDETLALYAGRPRAVVFSALQQTVERYQIPAQPFLDLIDAFEQDQRVDRYRDLRPSCTTTAGGAPTRSAGWCCTCAGTGTRAASGCQRPHLHGPCNWRISGRTSAGI